MRYLGHEVDKDQASAYIFMEYCSGGDLRTVLRSFGGVAQAVASNYTRQVVRGLGYLHDNDVLHRDIKGANILLFASGVCKLGDFGLARAVASIVPPGGTWQVYGRNALLDGARGYSRAGNLTQ